MSELKKCPFCGGEARWATRDKHWSECAVCGTEGINSEYSEDCIEAWNTRKPVERILERLEEKGAECKERAKEELNEFCLEMFHAYENEADGIKKAIEIIKEEVG